MAITLFSLAFYLSSVQFSCIVFHFSSIMSKRPRVDINPEHASDVVYSAIVESSFSQLPLCKYAIGYFLVSEVNDVNDFLSNLPEFFGYLKVLLTVKNFKRFLENLRKCVNKDSSANVQSVVSSVHRDPNQFKLHMDSTPLALGSPCRTCFPPINASFNTLDERCRANIVKFVQEEVTTGSSMGDIYKSICDNAFKVISCFDKSLVSYEENLLEEKNKFLIYKKTLETNLAKFDAHLKRHAAQIYFGSDLSAQNVQHLDRLIFCQDLEKVSISDHLVTLPRFKNISSADPELINFREDLFKDYHSHVLTNHCEPKFNELGKKYNLIGLHGSCGKTGSSKYAQSICLNMLMLPENNDLYKEILPILNINANTRSFYKPHPLVDNLTMPRLPTVQYANEIVNQMRIEGKILLGELMDPVSHLGWDIIKACTKPIVAHTRKIDFLTIRKHSLNYQSANKYLKGKPDEYYNNIDYAIVKSLLKEYSLISDTDSTLDEVYCRNLLKKAERTRHFALWYDHAVLLNRSYILFVLYPIYNASVYESSEMSEGDLEKRIEQPYIHCVGVSASTTTAEEAFQKFRNDQLMTLVIRLKTENGIEYTDKLKFVVGDGPVRCVESGQNKSGPFRLPTIMEKFPMDTLQYAEIMGFKHCTFEDQTIHANKGGFFDRPGNAGKSLQEEMKANPLALAKIRHPSENFQLYNTTGVRSFVYDELCGRRRPPIVYMNNPSSSPKDICADGLEISPTEPLHDLKGVLVKSLGVIPGIQKAEGILKKISDIISNSCNFDYDTKFEKSAESMFKELLEVVQKLKQQLFPEGLTCSTCGHIFTMSNVEMCTKCLYYTFYRSLLEIHIFGYKNSSKRNGISALTLHNLLFVFFKSMKTIQRSIPDAATVINSMYFINMVYYLGISFELQSPLSYHAGRLEDMFRQIKNLAYKFTNRKHFDESFLLNVIKRYELSKVYKTNHSKRHSTVSAAVTAFHEANPIPSVILTSEFVKENAHDVASHLCRISNFLVSNIDQRYMFIDSNMAINFRTEESCSIEQCDKTCRPCLSKMFPDFAIHHILTSSHKLILDTKQRLYSSFSSEIISDEGGTVDIEKLKVVIGQIEDSPTCVTVHRITSDMVIGSVDISRINISQVLLPPNLDSMIARFDSFPSNLHKLKSKTSKCVALLLHDVPEVLIRFDNSFKNLTTLNCNKNPSNEHNRHNEQGYYISRVQDIVALIQERLSCMQNAIETLCSEVDKLLETQIGALEDNIIVQRLRRLQAFKLIGLELLKSLRYELDAHNYFLYRDM